MFEPENDLERSLMRAASEPSHRAAFLRDLMDGEVFLALTASGSAPIAGPDGKMILPAGAKLELSSVRRGEEVFLPSFTAPARAHAIIPGDHVIAPDKTRDLFARYGDAQFVLNPGSDYGKEFPREEVDRLLRGDFGSDLEAVVVKKATQVLIGQPAHYPTEVVTALSAIFQDIPSVAAAYLCQVAYIPAKLRICMFRSALPPTGKPSGRQCVRSCAQHCRRAKSSTLLRCPEPPSKTTSVRRRGRFSCGQRLAARFHPGHSR